MTPGRQRLAPVPETAETDIPAYCPAGCRVWSGGGIPVVSLPEEVDVANVHLLRRALDAACPGATVMAVDMTKTTLFSAAGMGAVASAAKRLHGGGGELLLIVGDPHVRHVLAAVGFDRPFRVFTSLAVALETVRESRQVYQQAA
ncbi:MAG TPA: STAS domain-containing protein [Streptosporangiaceae bacterium]|nr:STAS domain-containing protein [Streptosporangiaceae bacterium]